MEKSENTFDMECHKGIEELLPLNGSSSPRRARSSHSKHTLSRLACLAIGIILASIVFFTIWSYGIAPSMRHLPHVIGGTDARTGKPNSWFNGDCGASAQEARSRGCRFDRLLHSWLSKDCTTAEDLADEEEFIKMDWTYYNDTSGTMIPTDIVYDGDMELVYTSFRWHLVHCTFVWKKLHRALLDGRNIDSYMASLDHTNHCSKLLLMEEDTGGYLTRIFTKFPTCG